MGRKNRFVQDTEVLIYRLNHGNLPEAKRLLEQIALAADGLAEDVDDPRKEFLEGTSELMSRFRTEISALEEEGKPESEIAELVLEDMNTHFSHDLTEFSLEPRHGRGSVDWESTADRLLAENQWLREELESSEKEYMELYRQAKDDGDGIESR